MAVPTYDKFIEPVLRFLATRPEGALVREVREAAAEMLGLNEQQRAEVITSGQLTYQNAPVGRTIVSNAPGYRRAYPGENGV